VNLLRKEQGGMEKRRLIAKEGRKAERKTIAKEGRKAGKQEERGQQGC
jgi:hypothetical protein